MADEVTYAEHVDHGPGRPVTGCVWCQSEQAAEPLATECSDAPHEAHALGDGTSWCPGVPAELEAVAGGLLTDRQAALLAAVHLMLPQDLAAITDVPADEVARVVARQHTAAAEVFEQHLQNDDRDQSQISDGYHTFAELYAHRRALTAALARAFGAGAWRSRLHHDGTMYDGMFIVGFYLPNVGDVSYHYELKHWEEFEHVPVRKLAPHWDGHTSDDVVRRLLQWAGRR